MEDKRGSKRKKDSEGPIRPPPHPTARATHERGSALLCYFDPQARSPSPPRASPKRLGFWHSGDCLDLLLAGGGGVEEINDERSRGSNSKVFSFKLTASRVLFTWFLCVLARGLASLEGDSIDGLLTPCRVVYKF